MKYSKEHITYIAGLYDCIDRHKADIRTLRKQIKRDKKRIRKVMNEPLERFQELAKHSEFLKGKDCNPYNMRNDGLSTCIILYVDSQQFVIDMSEWMGVNVTGELITGFNEMIEMKVLNA